MSYTPYRFPCLARSRRRADALRFSRSWPALLKATDSHRFCCAVIHELVGPYLLIVIAHKTTWRRPTWWPVRPAGKAFWENAHLCFSVVELLAFQRGYLCLSACVFFAFQRAASLTQKRVAAKIKERGGQRILCISAWITGALSRVMHTKSTKRLPQFKSKPEKPSPMGK